MVDRIRKVVEDRSSLGPQIFIFRAKKRFLGRRTWSAGSRQLTADRSSMGHGVIVDFRF